MEPKKFYGNRINGNWLMANEAELTPRELEVMEDEYDWKPLPANPKLLWPHCKMSGQPLVYDEAE